MVKGSELVDATRFLVASCRLGQPLGEALRLVADPEVVAKSYPAFWRHLEQAGFRVER